MDPEVSTAKATRVRRRRRSYPRSGIYIPVALRMSIRGRRGVRARRHSLRAMRLAQAITSWAQAGSGGTCQEMALPPASLPHEDGAGMSSAAASFPLGEVARAAATPMASPRAPSSTWTPPQGEASAASSRALPAIWPPSPHSGMGRGHPCDSRSWRRSSGWRRGWR